MLSRRIRVNAVVAAAAALAVISPAVWQAQAQRAAPPAPVPKQLPVLRLEPGRSVGTALDKGATYHQLEDLAVRVRTVFDDAVAVSERTEPGHLEAALETPAGRRLATLTVLRLAGARETIHLEVPGERFVTVQAPTGLRASLDWAGRQVYTFWKDRSAHASSGPAWQQNLLRPAGVGPRNLDVSIREVETEWPGQVVARASWRQPLGPADRPGGGRRMAATFTRGGRDRGWVQWYADAKILDWSITGLTSGTLTDDALGEIGGWPFTPDLAWLNVQAFAFEHFQSNIARRQAAVRSQSPTGLAALVKAVMPTLHAQDGCTGLHWLDSSIVRPCCDRHDLCFNKYGCDRYSWLWPYSYSWQCTACNADVVFCFTGAALRPWHREP